MLIKGVPEYKFEEFVCKLGMKNIYALAWGGVLQMLAIIYSCVLTIFCQYQFVVTKF